VTTAMTLARAMPGRSEALALASWSTPRVSLLTDDRARPRLALAGLLCLAGFLIVALLVRAGATAAIDTAGLDALKRLHGTPLDPFFVAVSELGVADILGFFSMFPVGFLWVMGARRAAVYVGVAYLLAALVSDAIKAFMPLARPSAAYQIPLRMPESEDFIWAALAIILVLALWRTRWRWGAVIGAILFGITVLWDPTPLSTAGMDSFPSGHAFRSIVLVTSLLSALPYRPSRRVMGALIAVVILIGVSRVYLGEHHPSDVIAGWLAGFALIAALTVVPLFRSRDEAARIEATAIELSGGDVVAG
jgi:membrane-associated phospholipid phosphatase